MQFYIPSGLKRKVQQCRSMDNSNMPEKSLCTLPLERLCNDSLYSNDDISFIALTRRNFQLIAKVYIYNSIVCLGCVTKVPGCCYALQARKGKTLRPMPCRNGLSLAILQIYRSSYIERGPLLFCTVTQPSFSANSRDACALPGVCFRHSLFISSMLPRFGP